MKPILELVGYGITLLKLRISVLNKSCQVDQLENFRLSFWELGKKKRIQAYIPAISLQVNIIDSLLCQLKASLHQILGLIIVVSYELSLFYSINSSTCIPQSKQRLT